jgi:hypothetical protein
VRRRATLEQRAVRAVRVLHGLHELHELRAIDETCWTSPFHP